MALHGLGGLEIADIDLLMSRKDALRMLREHGVAGRADGGTDRFRSEVFGQLPGLSLSVDVMAGFQVWDERAWREVLPTTRMAVAIPSGLVFVPTLPELIAIARRLGRGKDLARAEMLEALR